MVTKVGACEETIRPSLKGNIVLVNDQQDVIEKMNLLLSVTEQLIQLSTERRECVEKGFD